MVKKPVPIPRSATVQRLINQLNVLSVDDAYAVVGGLKEGVLSTIKHSVRGKRPKCVLNYIKVHADGSTAVEGAITGDDMLQISAASKFELVEKLDMVRAFYMSSEIPSFDFAHVILLVNRK